MPTQVLRYLSDLGRHLHLALPQKRRILREIRSHIEDSARELMDQGVSSDDAFSTALNDLGTSRSIARQLYQVHAQGSWYHTSLAVLPHILLSLMFALGLWTSPGWFVVLLLAAVVISVFGWRKGRPTWTYPWLGYCLVAPIVSWGLAASAIGYGAWGVLTERSLPLGIPIYAASFVYFSASLWIVFRILTRVAQPDWVMVSLAILPVPFLTYWFLFFYSQEELLSSHGAPFQGVDSSAAIVFLLLAVATALFFRIGRRLVRVGLLLITAPSVLVMGWLSYQGGRGYAAIFALAACSLLFLLLPALLDQKPAKVEDYSLIPGDAG